MKKHSNQERIHRFVTNNSGFTACQIANKLRMSDSSPYWKMTVLRSLHRLCDKGLLKKAKYSGVRKSVKAWHWVSIK